MQGGGRDGLGNHRGHARVEGGGIDVVGTQFVDSLRREGIRRSELRAVGDAGGADDSVEGEEVIDLVRAAPVVP